MTSGIYKITSPSGKCYIGSAMDISQRWCNHRTKLRANQHHCEALQRAAIKYGVDALSFEIIEICDIPQLIAREQFHIDNTVRPLLYNSQLIAGSQLGFRHKSETKARMSKLNKARTAEQRENHARTLRGRKHTEAHRVAISEGNKGRVHSAETRGLLSSRRKLPASGYRCVNAHKSGKWTAAVYVRGKKRHIGQYSTPELAYAMRLVYIAALPEQVA